MIEFIVSGCGASLSCQTPEESRVLVRALRARSPLPSLPSRVAAQWRQDSFHSRSTSLPQTVLSHSAVVHSAAALPLSEYRYLDGDPSESIMLHFCQRSLVDQLLLHDGCVHVPAPSCEPLTLRLAGGEAGWREPLLLRELPRQAERHPQDQTQQPSSDPQSAAHALHLRQVS